MEEKESPTRAKMKSVTSLRATALAFGCSHPTLYKYIDQYDKGEYDRIPPALKSFIDGILDETINASNVYMKLDEPLFHQQKNMSQGEKDLVEVFHRLHMIDSKHRESIKDVVKVLETNDAVLKIKVQSEIELLKKEKYRSMGVESYLDICDKLQNMDHDRRVAVSEMVDTVEQESKQKERMKAQEEYFTGYSECSWEEGQIRTFCVNSPGKTMVVFEANESQAGRTSIEILLSVDGFDVIIDELRPREGARYVIVEGLPPAPYLYRAKRIGDGAPVISDIHILGYKA